MRFRRQVQQKGECGRKQRIPLLCIILMAIGFLTLLYLAIVYVLMPLLAMMTVS